MSPASFLRAALALACACVLALPALAQESDGASAPASAHAPPLPEGETVTINVPHAGVFGSSATMTAQVYRPAGDGPFPVVLFSHGRAPDAVDRAHLKVGISHAQLRFWLARGNAVVSPVRPGYGVTGGPDGENSGSHFNSFGQCTTTPDYRKVATAAVRSVDATLAWLRAQPWADTHHVLLVGQSMGGLTSVAAGARPVDGVVGYINFAGGAGGNPTGSPGHSCDAGQLTEIYGEFGRATVMPNLWVYTMNDQYFGPDAPAAWHESFARGGSRTTFVHAPALADGDGHGLSRHAQRLWAPYVESFLATIDFPATGAARR